MPHRDTLLIRDTLYVAEHWLAETDCRIRFIYDLPILEQAAGFRMFANNMFAHNSCP